MFVYAKIISATIKIILPYLYMKFTNGFVYFNCEAIALKPSSGYIGKILKTSKTKFVWNKYKVKYTNIWAKIEVDWILQHNKNSGYAINAKIKFDKIPEMLTSNVSLLIFLKLNALIGTGLAQPNPNTKKLIKPILSKWAIGLKVNLPADFGVGSPNLYAVKAWANSWTVSAIRTAKVKVKKIITFVWNGKYDWLNNKENNN